MYSASDIQRVVTDKSPLVPFFFQSWPIWIFVAIKGTRVRRVRRAVLSTTIKAAGTHSVTPSLISESSRSTLVELKTASLREWPHELPGNRKPFVRGSYIVVI